MVPRRCLDVDGGSGNFGSDVDDDNGSDDDDDDDDVVDDENTEVMIDLIIAVLISHCR